MPRRMLSLRGAAERLGVCHKTVRAWIAQGEGPPVMVIPGQTRNTYRIDAADLERWIERRTKGARR